MARQIPELHEILLNNCWVSMRWDLLDNWIWYKAPEAPNAYPTLIWTQASSIVLTILVPAITRFSTVRASDGILLGFSEADTCLSNYGIFILLGSEHTPN